jgi:hypothetical protein
MVSSDCEETMLALEHRRAAYETIATPEEVPLYDMVPVRGPDGEVLHAYRGVRRTDTREVISVMSSRYGLVQHAAVSKAVHAIAQTLEAPEKGAAVHPFPREQIRLSAGGRRLEHKLVIGRAFTLRPGESFFPGVRVANSLDGSSAVTVSGYALRLACCNQLAAGRAGALTELRELHLASSEDLLGQVEKAIHQFLANFDRALDLYASAMDRSVRVVDVGPALVEAGLPARHADAIQAELPALGGTPLWTEISKWEAYNAATGHLRDIQVSPERERFLERAAARALLLPAEGAGSAMGAEALLA